MTDEIFGRLIISMGRAGWFILASKCVDLVLCWSS